MKIRAQLTKRKPNLNVSFRCTLTECKGGTNTLNIESALVTFTKHCCFFSVPFSARSYYTIMCCSRQAAVYALIALKGKTKFSRNDGAARTGPIPHNSPFMRSVSTIRKMALGGDCFRWSLVCCHPLGVEEIEFQGTCGGATLEQCIALTFSQQRWEEESTEKVPTFML